MARFQPGRSGNPNGKPKGARSHTARAFDGLLSKKDQLAIIQAVVDKAKAGDVSAANALMDRFWPKRRAAAADVQLDLPAGSLTQRGEAVISAVCAGELTVDAAADLLQALSALAKLVETTEFAERLAALEAKLTPKGERK